MGIFDDGGSRVVGVNGVGTAAEEPEASSC
jgi:hypothetical protein